jgi:hypothetical protein
MSNTLKIESCMGGKHQIGDFGLCAICGHDISPKGIGLVENHEWALAEIERLQKRNSELHRRCQQAESAVSKFKREWDKHGGPRGGSFGRALLACYSEDLARRLAICHADAHYISVEWLRENGHQELAKVVENIRKHSSPNDRA